MNGGTDWLSALGILLAGLVLGFMFVYAYVMRRRDVVAPVSGDLELLDLEAKRDALLQQLREAEDDAEERARLEVEAAQVLRAIDVRTQTPGVVAGAPARPGGRGARRLTETRSSIKPEVKGFLWGSGSTAALALLLFFGYTKMQPKDVPPGQGAPMQQPAQAQAPQADPSLAALEARVKSNPDDLALRLELTHAYLNTENLMGVFDQTEYILKKNPNDAQAQTYQALVRMAMGQRDDALKLLKSATKNDPSLLDAWVTLAWYYMQVGKKSEARAAIDEGLKRHPDEQARLEAVWQQMQAPQNPAATPAASMPNTPAASSGDGISITLNLGSGNANGNGVLFVIARAEGVTAGPPVAVKRIAAATFPMTIDLGAADSMMGQAFPPKVRIEARLDADGNAMTKDPNDPAAVQDGVAVGSKVSLTLK
jgi:tetratricopeptide (TPR) repeat protein